MSNLVLRINSDDLEDDFSLDYSNSATKESMVKSFNLDDNTYKEDISGTSINPQIQDLYM
jgi:hypothetical protein